ncbi:MAG: 23S rRNA (uracil-5-)-methyltransferase RumA [Deltaproteobacteria bacterium RIFOXYB12_FULL_58_9]|nr:MAG: 23S rRNA (uracil-5-)-methyltransferase RumA [Deltaproteobacteria bacterium RIFOXYB12_FULL_58_9]
MTTPRSYPKALCSLFGRCGGCANQNVEYGKQLRNKRKMLFERLAHMCATDCIEPVVGLTPPFGYRTRLLMPAIPDGRREPPFRLGLYERHSSRLLDVAGCPVQHPLTLATAAMVQQVLASSPITATAPNSDKGWLHGLGVRVDPQSGAAEVTLVGKSHTIPGGNEIARRIVMLPGVSGVHLSVNPGRSSYLLGDEHVHLAGNKRTVFHLANQAFHVSAGAFFQTSLTGAEILVEQVLGMLPTRFPHLADLYGGVGVFARLTEERWNKAIVAESNPYAVADLHEWIEQTGCRSLRVARGRTEDVMHEVLEPHPDVVILDPPRSGCHPRVISELGRIDSATILYIACSLDALVRDGNLLLDAGYRIDRVSSVDMFPHTDHLEVVVRFVR